MSSKVSIPLTICIFLGLSLPAMAGLTNVKLGNKDAKSNLIAQMRPTIPGIGSLDYYNRHAPGGSYNTMQRANSRNASLCISSAGDYYGRLIKVTPYRHGVTCDFERASFRINPLNGQRI